MAWGRCYESIGMPSYWPWVQAIRSYVREQDPEQLRLEMGTGVGEIAEIVPDVRERLPGLEPSPDWKAWNMPDSVFLIPSPASWSGLP